MAGHGLEKAYHDDHVPADGKLGAVRAVQKASHERAYDGIEQPADAEVMMRDMPRLDSDGDCLVSKAAAVQY